LRYHLRDHAYNAVALQEPRMPAESIGIASHVVYHSRPLRPCVKLRSALLVRRQLAQTEVELSDLCTEVAEFVAVTVELGKRSLTIVSAYVAPVLGDKEDTPRGRQLQSTLDRLDLWNITSGSPMFDRPGVTGSVMDLIFTSWALRLSATPQADSWGSDHNRRRPTDMEQNRHADTYVKVAPQWMAQALANLPIPRNPSLGMAVAMGIQPAQMVELLAEAFMKVPPVLNAGPPPESDEGSAPKDESTYKHAPLAWWNHLGHLITDAAAVLQGLILARPLYALPLVQLSANQLKNLEETQRVAFRICLGVPRTASSRHTLTEAGLNSVENALQAQALGHLIRMSSCDSTIPFLMRIAERAESKLGAHHCTLVDTAGTRTTCPPPSTAQRASPEDHIRIQYDGRTRVYTDGSVHRSGGSVTAAAFFQAEAVGTSERLAHQASSTTAEPDFYSDCYTCEEPADAEHLLLHCRGHEEERTVLMGAFSRLTPQHQPGKTHSYAGVPSESDQRPARLRPGALTCLCLCATKASTQDGHSVARILGLSPPALRLPKPKPT
ncbi:hypothetical protein HPB47_000027, partial [Ixodes persulcatus]